MHTMTTTERTIEVYRRRRSSSFIGPCILLLLRLVSLLRLQHNSMFILFIIIVMMNNMVHSVDMYVYSIYIFVAIGYRVVCSCKNSFWLVVRWNDVWDPTSQRIQENVNPIVPVLVVIGESTT
jgi:hypothetical protein